MVKKNPILEVFELVNRLYSINYSSLRIYEQMRSQYSAENFKFSMPFQKPESWVDAKMTDVNNLRADLNARYYESDEKNKEQFIVLDNELERSKEYLQYVYNVLYEKECSFEEIFDGFLCKAPDLLEFVCVLEMQPLMTNNPNVKHLIDAYSGYMSNMFYKTVMQSMRDLIQQLNRDFNSNGTPSLYKGVIENDDVIVISAEKIKSLRKESDDLHKKIKSKKVKKFTGYDYTKNMATSKYFELDIMIGVLEERLKSANTDIVNTLSNKIVESTMDYLTGVKLDKKPEVAEIYATRKELNYIEFLKEMINYALVVLNENMMQENKQKGET